MSQFGFDIIRSNEGACLATRYFEMAELKLLVDAVQSSKFITEKKSEELIEKLNQFSSQYESKQLNRQVFVRNRVKTMNESIYYNVDAIYQAMELNRKIGFLYYNWNEKKEMEPRRNGRQYVVSPWFLQYEDEKYYLIAYDDKATKLKHYRVDKIKQVELLSETRTGREQYEVVSQSSYQQQFIHMFQGENATITLHCENELANVIVDRFGKGVWMHPIDEEHFSTSFDISVSSSFFGWLASLGTKAEIKEPLWVREQYYKHLDAILRRK